MMTKTTNLHRLADRGFHLFPLLPGQKRPPKGVKWREVSTTSHTQIDTWVRERPDYNWGIDCGKSGICVVDVDNKGEKSGSATLALYEVEHGDIDDLEIIGRALSADELGLQ